VTRVHCIAASKADQRSSCSYTRWHHKQCKMFTRATYNNSSSNNNNRTHTTTTTH